MALTARDIQVEYQEAMASLTPAQMDAIRLGHEAATMLEWSQATAEKRLRRLFAKEAARREAKSPPPANEAG